VLHHRLIVMTLFCNLIFGIAHGGDHFSCAANGEAADDVATVRTTLAGVPAILRVPKVIRKPPIVLWHGLGPPAGESELMKA
jgi:hypothetical protein